jgi:hypothetical protein
MRFRQILGVQIAIANAEMKVMRSHMVGKTPEEAMMLANKESNNQKFWDPNTNCPAYFSASYGQWSSSQFWYDRMGTKSTIVHPGGSKSSKRYALVS